MRYRNSTFSSLLKPIARKGFERIVNRHGGDAYIKQLTTWNQFVALVYSQLSNASSLRGIEAGWNANSHHHYHLGANKIHRSTLADANQKRPSAIFAELFLKLSISATPHLKKEGAEIVRLLDSSPIPLGELFKCRESNGRINGMKLHVVYDPHADHPNVVEMSKANVNDIEFGKKIEIEPGTTYVYDKGYVDYKWWTKLHDKDCIFVTRPKTNMHLKIIEMRPGPYLPNDGFTVLEDAVVRHSPSGKNNLKMPLRRLVIKRHQDHSEVTIISNDLKRSADEIAVLYKLRWRIELLFRWIKQHLKIRSFIGRSENAVEIQIFVAMITFLLLRIAAKNNNSPLPPIRFAELVGALLFERKSLTHIDKPPRRPDKPPYTHPDQMELAI